MLASCGEVFLDVREVRWWNRHREDAVALGDPGALCDTT
jgi:hypothetical protein